MHCPSPAFEAYMIGDRSGPGDDLYSHRKKASFYHSLASTIRAFVAAVFIMASTIISSSLVMAVIPALTMSFLITRNIILSVPVVSYKEDALAAGVVLRTVLFPVLSVFLGH